MRWSLFSRKPIVDLAEARRILEALRAEPETNDQDMVVGDPVRVIEGPFKDMSGVIESIDESRGCVTAKIKVFGRDTPVELHFAQLKKSRGTES